MCIYTGDLLANLYIVMQLIFTLFDQLFAFFVPIPWLTLIICFHHI